jgi:micrococcal nuclease
LEVGAVDGPWERDNIRRVALRRRRRLVPSAISLAPVLILWLGLAAALWPSLPKLSLPDLSPPSFGRGETVAGTHIFRLCARPPHHSCVMDGDTFYWRGDSIRIADIDAPETHPPRCPTEALLGAEATNRLRDLLSTGPFEIRRAGFRDADRYGRKLRTVYRDGESLGDILVAEGLAREWSGRRQPWCS